MTKKKPLIKETQPLNPPYILEVFSEIPVWKLLADHLIQHFAHRLNRKDKDEIK